MDYVVKNDSNTNIIFINLQDIEYKDKEMYALKSFLDGYMAVVAQALLLKLNINHN